MEIISSFSNAQVRDGSETYVENSQKQRGYIVRLLPRTPRSFEETSSKLLGFFRFFGRSLVEVCSKFGRNSFDLWSKFGRYFLIAISNAK